MGKNLKGKECGRGICQRKDGLYFARFNDKYGSRHQKCFKTLPEARNWLEDAKYEDKHGIAPTPKIVSEFTVDAWFSYWMENLVCGLAPNTRRNYWERYVHNIQPNLGNLYMSQVLEYTDLRSGEKKCFIMKDLAFVNWRTGEPNKNSSYDTHFYKLCDEARIRHFCMHALRHTYATRAIEAGMQPKVLQKLLGHASIKTTMDRYVGVTDDSLICGVHQFGAAYAEMV